MTYIDHWISIDTTATGIALEGLNELTLKGVWDIMLPRHDGGESQGTMPGVMVSHQESASLLTRLGTFYNRLNLISLSC